jgi:hypothetical protein
MKTQRTGAAAEDIGKLPDKNVADTAIGFLLSGQGA